MAKDTELEAALAQVEARLGTLNEALRTHHADAVAGAAAELQRALQALRRGALAGPPSRRLRARLALAGGHVAAQRESLARAGAALQRALDVLLPGTAPRVAYSAAGLSQRPASGGALQA